MKTFKFKYTPVMKTLLIASLLLSTAGFALNLWRFFSIGPHNVYDWIQYVLLLVVTVLCPTIVVPMMIRSEYVVTERELLIRFGLIKTSVKLADVEKLSLDKASKKLSVWMKDQTFQVVIVDPEWHDDFVAAMRERQPKIDLEYVDGNL
ncbi:MAG: hypothetical protein ACI4U2_06360 [Christensenellaceae bacterium]